MAISLRTFGNSGLDLPCIGLGLAALGRPGYINLGHADDLNRDYDVNMMKNRCHDMIDLAADWGIRYFDVAQSYGKAEEFMMSWLKMYRPPADAVVVGSKWGYTYTANWKVEAEQHEVKEHSLSVLNHQWDFTQHLLPNLRIYQIHSATFQSGVLENTTVLERLAQLKYEHNLIIGLSLSGEQQAEVLEKALEIKVENEALFGSVQATFNVLEQSAENSLYKAADQGLGIIIKEGVANGRLTNRNAASSFSATKLILEAIAKKYFVEIDAIALAYTLSKPWAQIVLSGAATPDQLLSNIQASNIELDAKDIETLTGLQLPASQYWQARKQLIWN